MLEGAILVVAHPDDEVLWFGSILRQVGKVIIAFRDYAAVAGLGERRAAALAELPYGNLQCLGLAEAGSLKRANWDGPTPTEYGLALDEATERSETRLQYESNFAALRAALANELRAGIDVFTHNPWGEYGHEDHVQVYRAVESLREAIGFRLWTSSYCSTRAAKLASRYSAADQPVKRLPIDQDYATTIAAIYERHACWTWTRNWEWDEQECFLPGPFRMAAASQSGLREQLRFVASEL
ncbi:MAG TPA: hypothetical protein VGJ75_03005 [Dongiaceae bacterium]|jgi:LmbE family N-acetylglucosaminyl deacetylase